MTAEIVVLNREAIAIAADSAVSLGSTARKVYNTANKLFELSTAEPIAIMVYGAASFGPIPWETVIKQYRNQLGARSFETVDEYAEDFIEHLANLVEHHPRDLQLAVAERAILFELEWAVKNLEQEIFRKKVLHEVFQHVEKSHFLDDSVTARLTKLSSQECRTVIDDSTAEGLVDEIFSDWLETVRNCFEGIRDFSIAIEQADLLRPLARAALRSLSMDAGASGVVVAGFGTKQIFPAWTNYGVDAVVADTVRARHLDRFEVIPVESIVDIRPFAQDDMVLTFLNGIHPNYVKALKGFVAEALEVFVDGLQSATDDAGLTAQLQDYMSQVEEARMTANREFHGRLEEELFDLHKNSILSVVSSLPKEELAEFAETLVSLTSFKRRMTPDTETVGGPIDVAVISKGDGMVWVKRKHYFDRKFNLRYFERNRNRDDATSA